MIPVTKPYLPDKKKLYSYFDLIYESEHLTNRGPLLQKLESRLQEYLSVKNVVLVANGSIALQLVYKALGLKGEVLTTPFSFVATTSTLVWEGLKPVFVDIDKNSFNLDPTNIESSLTEKTSAILPVHVFGNPCDVESIKQIASKSEIKVIYDAAHAFGVKHKNKSIFQYGDASTVSFHATKLFHTVEGGAVITDDDSLAENIRSLLNFGIDGSHNFKSAGTNAKMNEFEAAMGLCVLDDIDLILENREQTWNYYYSQLKDVVEFQQPADNSQLNYHYAPIVFEGECDLLKVKKELKTNSIFSRRYFYPSLDTLSYIDSAEECPISRFLSERILCLPTFYSLQSNSLKKIVKIIQENSKRRSI